MKDKKKKPDQKVGMLVDLSDKTIEEIQTLMVGALLNLYAVTPDEALERANVFSSTCFEQSQKLGDHLSDAQKETVSRLAAVQATLRLLGATTYAALLKEVKGPCPN